MRTPGTRLISSVGYFPERYGEDILSLAVAILTKQLTPPAIFIKHELITSSNVNHHYPNDILLSRDAVEAGLFRAP